MANLPSSIHLPKRIANVFFKLLKVTKNLYQSAGSIAFIGKCLHLHVTPNFAVVNGQFTNDEDKFQVERYVMASHLTEHLEKMKSLLTMCLSQTM